MTARPLASRPLVTHRLPTPGRILLALVDPLRRRWQAILDAEHLADQPSYLLADIGLGADDVERIRRGECPIRPRTLHRTTTVDRTGGPA